MEVEPMDGIAMILAAKAIRQADGLHVRFTGPDYAEPFDAYAKDAAQRDRWIAAARARGNVAEIVGA